MIRRMLAPGAILLALGLTSGEEAAPGDQEVVHLQERIVPEEVFARIQKDHPGGVVMSLLEYRALVAKALQGRERHSTWADPTAELSAIRSARYEGRVHPSRSTARFTAKLEVQATRDDWVFVDLGSIADRLGGVRVDGSPGWIVTREGGALLAVRGKGLHEVELDFHLPVEDLSADRFRVSADRLPSALAARLELVVPGLAEGESAQAGGTLERVVEVGQTRFRLGLAAPIGSAAKFQIEWRVREIAGENVPLLAASHAFLAWPRGSGASAGGGEFWWEATVEVARKAAKEIVLVEPAGTQILGIEGSLVHSTHRDGARIVVVLREELLGTTSLSIHGVLAPGGDVEIAAPEIEGASSNWGTLVLADPVTARIRVTSSEGLEEVALSEVAVPAPEPKGGSPAGPIPIRAFRYRAPGARLVARLADRAARFEASSASALVLGETSALLHSSWQVRPLDGRLHQLSITLPAGWTFVSAAESTTALGVAAERVELGDSGGTVLLTLATAALEGRPLEFDLHLELANYPKASRAWRETALALELPILAGADRVESTLGIFLADRSLELAATRFAGWHGTTPDEVRLVGFARDGSAEGFLRLAACLRTDAAQGGAASGRAKLEAVVHHRESRGEFRAVTHLVASENKFRVWTELVLAVVASGLEEVVVRLPALPESAAVSIVGEGIRELEHGNAAGRHVVRFVRPWVGMRRFSIEYEVESLPLERASSAVIPVPIVDIEGDFGGERYVAVESVGSVEVEVKAGPGLLSVGADELPEFGGSRSERGSRFLGAYRLVSENVGTVEARVHARAPAIGHVVRRLELTTEIGADGTIRTHAEALLAYGSLQALGLELPPGAKLVTVAVAGEPVRVVWKGRTGLSVPLPPRGAAIVSIGYDQPAPDPVNGGLGGWGSLGELAGPTFLDGETPIPVGETVWKLQPPRGYRFAVAGGNMSAPADHAEATAARIPGFAGSFPSLTTWSAPLDDDSPPDPIVVSRLGGAPVVILTYASVERRDPTRRGVFLAVFAAACFLYARYARYARTRSGVRRSRRNFWIPILASLALGTAIPVALGRESELLAVPFCEALFAAAVLAGAVSLVERARPYLWKRLWCLLLAPGLLATAVLGEEGQALPKAAPVVEMPFDSVWVSPSADSAGEARAFLTEEQLHRLHRMAYPDPEAPLATSFEIALGSVEYSLDVVGDEFRLAATVPVHVFGPEWVTLEVPAGPAPLVRATLDGAPAGLVARFGLPIHGEGDHAVGLEWRGKIETVLGESRVRVESLVGGARSRGATLRVRLPEGSELKSAGGALVVLEPSGEHVFDLGSARDFEISWREGSRPQADLASQALASVSYSGLTLTPYGYEVDRWERATASGRPLDRLTYRIAGDWEITSVTGEAVSEWLVAPTDEDPPGRRLVVSLQGSSDLSQVEFRVRGVANLEAQARPVATLSLESAARQETFVGISHGGATRRFQAEILTGMSRVTLDDVRRSLRLADPSPAPERVYHSHTSAQGELVQAGGLPRVVDTRTDAVAVVAIDRVRAFVRVFYQSGVSQGPLVYEAPLGPDWEVRLVESAELRDWEVLETPADGRRLVVELSGRAKPGTEILWMAERRFGAGPESREVVLPDPWPAAESPGEAEIRQTTQVGWEIAAENGLEVSAGSGADRWERGASDARSRWLPVPKGTAYKNLVFRSRRAPGALPIRVSSEPLSRFSVTAVSVVRLTGESLLVQTRLAVDVDRGQVRKLSLVLPVDFELVAIETQDLQSRRVDGRKVEIELASPIDELGRAILLSTRARREGLAIPALAALGAFDAAGKAVPVESYLVVLAPRPPFAVDVRPHLLAGVDLAALPFVPAGLTASPRATYRGAGSQDWRLELTERPVEVAASRAVVEVAELATLLEEDGTTRTRARYLVRHSGVQFLEVELPEGASLWGVTVGGWPVSVGRPGDSEAGRTRITIPLDSPDRSNLPSLVALYYEERFPTGRTTRSLSSPRLVTAGVKVGRTVWTIQVPAGYRVHDELGRMRLVPAARIPQERVESLVTEKTRIEEVLAAAPNERARVRALRDLARLEQSLGDEVAELERTDRESGASRDPSGELDEAELESQRARNDSVLRDARTTLARLREERGRAPGVGDSPEIAELEAAFLEALWFLEGTDWEAPGAPPGEAPSAEQGPAALQGMFRGRPFQGWAERGWPRAGADVVSRSVSLALDETRRTDAGDGPGRLEIPGIEAFEPRPGRTTYAFQSLDEVGRLELVLTSESDSIRFGSWGFLALAGVALAAVAIRRVRGAIKLRG